MPFPKNVSAIDLMVSIPTDEHNSAGYQAIAAMQRDGPEQQTPMPAGYMFKHVPMLGPDPAKYVEMLLAAMDKHNVGKALLSMKDCERHPETAERHADRFFFSTGANPFGGMDEVRRLRQLKRDRDIKAITYFPSASLPQIAINAKEMYPIYATAIDLDLPILVNVGVPGPRMPLAPQKVELVDEVCWFYPELKFGMRHGGEPWEDLTVKLMLKYPNLYYATSAFAPKYYPEAIIDYANSRGAHKIMYAGYFASGLTLDRIFAELEQVPFKDEVWPLFLRENAARVFNL